MKALKFNFYMHIILLSLLLCSGIDAKQNYPFPVPLGDKYVFIDTEGNIVIDNEYDGGNQFSEGLAAVKIDNKWGYIDSVGNLIIKPRFDIANKFSEGLAAVELNKKIGYINRAGKMVIDPMRASGCMPFKHGFARIINGNNRWGFIHRSEKMNIETKFSLITDMTKRGYFFEFKKRLVGIYKHGKNLINTKFKLIDPQHQIVDGLFPVIKDDKCGFINVQGKIIIPFVYNYASDFSEDVAHVKVNGKSGFIDKNGNTVIPFQSEFHFLDNFHEGLARILFRDSLGIGKVGFVDKTLRTVIEPKFGWMTNFINGIAVGGYTTGDQIYINRKGKQIWPKLTIKNDQNNPTLQSLFKILLSYGCIIETTKKDCSFSEINEIWEHNITAVNKFKILELDFKIESNIYDYNNEDIQIYKRNFSNKMSPLFNYQKCFKWIKEARQQEYGHFYSLRMKNKIYMIYTDKIRQDIKPTFDIIVKYLTSNDSIEIKQIKRKLKDIY